MLGFMRGLPAIISLLLGLSACAASHSTVPPATATTPPDAHEGERSAELPETTSAGETPRVLHLRDAHFGIEFDAPDDTWLATGPREAGGGSQVIWSWANADRQIDVQVLDVTRMAKHPTPDFMAKFEESLVQKTIETEEQNGTVVRKKSVLAGKPCHHLVMDRSNGRHWDLFVLFVDTTNYSLLVSQPKRDPALVETARKGFRFKSAR